jgi:RimJ/RimL family protein N-acetyltransferase
MRLPGTPQRSSPSTAPSHLARIEAWVEPDNEASQRVLEANGFQREGLLRSFLVLGSRRTDVFVYSRIRA